MIWTSGDDLATWPVRDERARVWWINAIRCWFECISKFNNLARVCVCNVYVIVPFNFDLNWFVNSTFLRHSGEWRWIEWKLGAQIKSIYVPFRTYKHTAHKERDAILSEQFHYEANLSSIRWHLFLALSYTIQYICLRFVKILVTAFIELYSIRSV